MRNFNPLQKVSVREITSATNTMFSSKARSTHNSNSTSSSGLQQQQQLSATNTFSSSLTSVAFLGSRSTGNMYMSTESDKASITTTTSTSRKYLIKAPIQLLHRIKRRLERTKTIVSNTYHNTHRPSVTGSIVSQSDNDEEVLETFEVMVQRAKQERRRLMQQPPTWYSAEHHSNHHNNNHYDQSMTNPNITMIMPPKANDSYSVSIM
ncbi:hypothetical protein H4219_006038 [Mycoemilia scoparia]|uniref:Uncharacterized protein n=1 Tax=Mycoemilia scoparia TaxID=417184 RepID=A0A9W7ZRV7_9FUNG|nr:hypothetical protein H4219_006038 [Mycoemilia scoparia]